ATCPADRARQVAGDHRHVLALILDSLVQAPASIRTAAPATSAKRPGCTMVGLAGQVTLTVGGRPPGWIRSTRILSPESPAGSRWPCAGGPTARRWLPNARRW